MKDLIPATEWNDPIGGTSQLVPFKQWMLAHWDKLDSTNSAAIRALVNKENGLTSKNRWVFSCTEQSEGRGRFNRPWSNEGGKDIAMSVILTEGLPTGEEFLFNAAISLAFIHGIEQVLPPKAKNQLTIKWPNDIFLKQKKIGGILIENNWRGQTWEYSVIGMGLNVFGIPKMYIADNLSAFFEKPDVIPTLKLSILSALSDYLRSFDHCRIMTQYEKKLFGLHGLHTWQLGNDQFSAKISHVAPDGRIHLTQSNITRAYQASEIKWIKSENHTQ